MTQPSLFDVDPRKMRRNTDPESSHEAAERVTRSGKAASQRERVYGAVKLHPGWPARGLADFLAFLDSRLSRSEWYYAVCRRLSELRSKGLIRSELREHEGKKLQHWYPV